MEIFRSGRIQLLMFSVSHFLAEQQTFTVSEISIFLNHWTLNVHFNCTIVNLKQWVIGANIDFFVSRQKTGFAALAAWHNQIIFEISISTCLPEWKEKINVQTILVNLKQWTIEVCDLKWSLLIWRASNKWFSCTVIVW